MGVPRKREVLQFLGSPVQQMCAALAASWVCRLPPGRIALGGVKLGAETCAIMYVHRAKYLDDSSIVIQEVRRR
jgi:hypothetical protein